MASMTISGINETLLSYEQLARLPNSVLDKMLDAKSTIVIKAQKATAPKNSGKLAMSITGSGKKQGSSGRYMNIYPKGTHHVSKKSLRKATNAEVGFVQEYGASGRNLKAQNWMRVANETSTQVAFDAAEKEYNNWLNSLGL